MRLAAVMFVGCVVEWAAAVNFGEFVDDAAAVVWAAGAAVSADVFVLAAAVAAVVLAAVTVWNAVLADVVVLAAAAASAAVALTSLACGALAASFAVDHGHGSAVELVHVPE